MKAKHLQLPVSEADIRELQLGDTVLLSGVILTGRDMAHRWMAEEKPEMIRSYLKNGAIYHCGPIMVPSDGTWTCRAAGPTSSTREEPYQADIIKEYRLRCIIGKGGMGERTAQALRAFGAVYLSAVGGAAVTYANAILTVDKVFQLDAFGVPEAMWVLNVKDFPLIVTMDSQGRSLHKDIEMRSLENARTYVKTP